MSTRPATPHPEDLAYPARDDGRGYAVKTYAGSNYYFGRHNTVESWALFGAWRAELIKTGEPPETKPIKAQIRVELRKAPSEDEPRPSYWRTVALCIAAGLAIAIMSSTATYGLLSRDALTAEEETILRGYRNQQARFAAEDRNQPGSIAAVLAEIREGKHSERITQGNGSERRGVGSAELGLLADRSDNEQR